MSSSLVSSNTLVTPGEFAQKDQNKDDSSISSSPLVDNVVYANADADADADAEDPVKVADDGLNNSAKLLKHDNMTPEEKDGTQEMLKSLTQEEKDSFPDDHMPLRHLRAEKGDVAKAIKAIQHTLQWRKEFGISDLVQCFQRQDEDEKAKEMATILATENETGKIYVRGYDKEGRAILYMRPGRENTNNELNNMRHLSFQLEKAIACSLAKNGRSKICLIIDYQGFRLKDSPPISTSRYTLDILQKHYPERMYRAYICNPPFVFRAFWAVVQPFIDPHTKTKTCFCSGKKGMATIVNDMGGIDIAHHSLEPCAGGTNAELKDFDSQEYLNLPWDQGFNDEQR